MNSQQRAAMQMALNALTAELAASDEIELEEAADGCLEAITALREALAQPQEPTLITRIAVPESNARVAQPQGEPVACSKDAPVHIYLQTGCDDEDCECAFNEWGDVTWCGEKIHNSDIHYVRADTTPLSVEAAIEETLEKAAKVCEELQDSKYGLGEQFANGHGQGCFDCAAAIRSMK